MYVNLDSVYLKKHWDSARSDAKAEGFDEDGKDMLFAEIGSDPEVEISEKEISAHVSTDLGFFSMSIPIEGVLLEKILEIAVKRMNKMRSALQALEN